MRTFRLLLYDFWMMAEVELNFFQRKSNPTLYPCRSYTVAGVSGLCKNDQKFATSPPSGAIVNFSADRNETLLLAILAYYNYSPWSGIAVGVTLWCVLQVPWLWSQYYSTLHSYPMYLLYIYITNYLINSLYLLIIIIIFLYKHWIPSEWNSCDTSVFLFFTYLQSYWQSYFYYNICYTEIY